VIINLSLAYKHTIDLIINLPFTYITQSSHTKVKFF